MPGIDTLHPRASELFRQLGTGNLYREAKTRGISLSALLEREDPSDPKERQEGYDAFGRLFRVAGIVPTNDPEGTYFADRLEEFSRDENTRALFPEWAARQWRKAQMSGTRAPAQYFSSDYPVGTPQRPYADQPGLRQQMIQPAIPLAEVIARNTGIDGMDYRAMYLVEPPASAVRMLRIGEATEIPRTKLTQSTRSIRLHKFGRSLEASYEALRRQRLDQVAVYLQRVAIQSQVDQVAAAFDVAINGDGNANTAAVSYNLTTLDPAASAGTLTAKGYLRFRMKWLNPYAMTVAFAQEDIALQMELLSLGNANIPLFGSMANANLGTPFSLINQSLADGVRLGITADAPANKIVGMDARLAVERVFENGSSINEAERWITRQVEVLTMSENEAYAVFDTNAVKVLVVNA